MWIEKRAEFQKRFDTIAQQNIGGIVTDLNKAISSYISKGGVSQDSTNNPDYNTIQRLSSTIEFIKSELSKLNDDIVSYIASESKDKNIGGLLEENGDLQKKIKRLEEIQKEMKIDVESAIARDELLRTKDVNISRHKLFVLDRPVKRNFVPFFWALAILFIGVGLTIFKVMIPPELAPTGMSIFVVPFYFLSDKRVLLALLAAAIITILFLSLKVAGVFGK
jgi:hypothetical protein